MKCALISFTAKGAQVNRGLSRILENTIGYHLSKYEEVGLEKVEGTLQEWTQKAFNQCEVIIYIGATGIAVRAIAPFLVSKEQDPAVLCIDELGKNVIPLVSGHIGGANQFARYVAQQIEGQAIISTATDLENRFAVDEWATFQGILITDLKQAKRIATEILRGETIGLVSDFPIEGRLPQQVECIEHGPIGIYIGYDQRKKPFEETLWLIPKGMSLGIGCKKGTPCEKIEKLVCMQLKSLGLSVELITTIASIDLKREEQGLLEWASDYNKPLCFYSAEELGEVEGDFTASPFVKHITGVENVCERAAVRASSGGKLILKKVALEGVTMALASPCYTVKFGRKV